MAIFLEAEKAFDTWPHFFVAKKATFYFRPVLLARFGNYMNLQNSLMNSMKQFTWAIQKDYYNFLPSFVFKTLVTTEIFLKIQLFYC